MNDPKILHSYRVDKMGKDTVFISNRFFNFSFTIADKVVKDEYKGMYKYFGGLQCEYLEESAEYKTLEKCLCEIAEKILTPLTS